MKEIDCCRNELRFETEDRSMYLIASIGYAAIAAYGVWNIAKGNDYGIIPTVLGTRLAVMELNDVANSTWQINFLREKISILESRQSKEHFQITKNIFSRDIR